MAEEETQAAENKLPTSNAVPLNFEYRNAAREERVVELHGWHEQGPYLAGRDARDGRYKTFRKDRVLKYLEAGDGRLQQPWTPPPPRLHEAKQGGMQVLFTGFEAVERKALETQAQGAGLKVVKSVTKGLRFLVCGKTAGWRKVLTARLQGIHPVNAGRFLEFLETGELPDVPEEVVGERGFSTQVPLPEEHFSGWAYEIGRHHWATLGLTYRTFTKEVEVPPKPDQHGSEPGAKKAPETRSVNYNAWAFDTPRACDFAQGDVFYSVAEPKRFIQVAFDHGGGIYEVHSGLSAEFDKERAGWEIETEQLAFWLETGRQPQMQPVFRGNSKAGLLAWYLPA